MNGIQEVSGSIPLISTIGKLLKLVLTHIKTSFFCLLGDFSPSSVTAYGSATFPRQGGRLIGASIGTTVQSSKCQCWRLPPHGGRWLAVRPDG